jgi:hypothetical protein
MSENQVKSNAFAELLLALRRGLTSLFAVDILGQSYDEQLMINHLLNLIPRNGFLSGPSIVGWSHR